MIVLIALFLFLIDFVVYRASRAKPRDAMFQDSFSARNLSNEMNWETTAYRIVVTNTVKEKTHLLKATPFFNQHSTENIARRVTRASLHAQLPARVLKKTRAV